MCSAADDPTTFDAPPLCTEPGCGRPLEPDHEHGPAGGGGHLALSTPWAREGIDPVGRAMVEARIPAELVMGVSVSANKAWWLMWLVRDGTPITSQLRVSHGMDLSMACLWALEKHWQVAA